jgi:hypothetical protein
MRIMRAGNAGFAQRVLTRCCPAPGQSSPDRGEGRLRMSKQTAGVFVTVVALVVLTFVLLIWIGDSPVGL